VKVKRKKEGTSVATYYIGGQPPRVRVGEGNDIVSYCIASANCSLQAARQLTFVEKGDGSLQCVGGIGPRHVQIVEHLGAMGGVGGGEARRRNCSRNGEMKMGKS
jgi:hypothetical protein